MTPVDLTQIVVGAATIVFGLLGPFLFKAFKSRSESGVAKTTSFRSLNEALQVQIDNQQSELDGIDRRYRDRMSALELECDTKLAKSEARLTVALADVERLKADLTAAYARLGRLDGEAGPRP